MEKPTIFSELWDSYKGIIIHSLITSFGLDFIVKDSIGGHVDTIHNVRNGVEYKNSANAAAYANRGEYDTAIYHNNATYSQMIREVRNKGFFEDEYVPGNNIMYGKQSALKHDTSHKANLDHVIAAKEIHDDPGRVLAGKSGVELANKQSNLKFTNEKLNKSMGQEDIELYIQRQKENGTPLSKETEEAMRASYKQARKEYEQELNEYYLSDRFINDVTLSSTRVGVAMGVRQALGYVFLEVWLACEKEIKSLPKGTSFKQAFEVIRNGVIEGFENAKKNYKQLLSEFKEGFISGILANLSITMINIFVTTGVAFAKIIRQGFVTCVQASNVLLFNPQNESLGGQLKRASIIVVTGASTVTGIIASEGIGKLMLPIDPFLLGATKNFIALLISGLLSCTTLVLIDRSALITNALEKLNKYVSYTAQLNNICDKFNEIACEIEGYDYSDLNDGLVRCNKLFDSMENKTDEEINGVLHDFFKENNISLPWEDDFDSFMSDKNNSLKFD